MRDLLILAIIFAGIPFILTRPWIGVIYWVWISVMNPHRLAWGFAHDFPVAQVIAIATLVGLFLTKEPRQMKGGGAAWVLLAFILYTCVTTAFSLVPDQAVPMLERVLKIQALTFVALLALHKREHVLWMVWMIALSVGYYAIKGGLFTIATLGAYRVWGPEDSFIAENNALALATIMTIPLWAYLFILYRGRWWRWALAGAIVLSAISSLGSQSRGALIAIGAMAIFLWLRSRGKILLGAALLALGVGLVSFMPQSWHDRMETMSTYNEDESAVGRIETWHLMFDIAKDRPLLGAGFEPYSADVLHRYRPEYPTVRAAHSVYFEVLGEHGFVGLALFLLFWGLTWSTARRISKETAGQSEEQWAFWLARMIQVSLIAYFVGGAFLSLAYWDVPYYLMVVLAVTLHAVRTGRKVAETSPPPARLSQSPRQSTASAAHMRSAQSLPK